MRPKRIVLLVDPDTERRALRKYVLEVAGYSVYERGSDVDAIEYLAAYHADLAVLDRVPALNIKERFPKVRVLALFRDPAADHWLIDPKPVDWIAAIREAMMGRNPKARLPCTEPKSAFAPKAHYCMSGIVMVQINGRTLARACPICLERQLAAEARDLQNVCIAPPPAE